MDRIISSFTVFFENPFWVGIFECESNVGYEVCKITFGSEPKDCEVYEFMLKNHHKLSFGNVKNSGKASKKCMNPKRMQRQIKKEITKDGVGTKAQQALKRIYEQSKAEHKSLSHEREDREKERKFELRREKKKEKHRGH